MKNILLRLGLASARVIVRLIFGTLAYRLPHGPHITRYTPYAHLRKVVGIDVWPADARCLSISGSRALCEIMGLRGDQILEADYPEHSLLDLRTFGDGEFDIVVSDQVLEHLEGDPQRAFAETWRVLKPGGLAVHTTCLINHIHWGPEDYWRFTPSALRYLARDFAAVLDVGGWGNRLAWLIDWADLRFVPVPHAKWHPLHKVAVFNEPAWLIVTWVVARK